MVVVVVVPAHPGSPGQRAVKRVCVCIFSPQSQSVYAVMTGFCVYDCFVNFPDHVTFYIVAVCQLCLINQ